MSKARLSDMYYSWEINKSQACVTISAYTYAMQNIVRKHKAYTCAFYSSDAVLLEKWLQELSTLFPRLISKCQNEPMIEQPSLPETKYSESEEFELPDADPSSGLRRVLYPKSLVKKFADIAGENTKKRIETCGILCGSEDKGVLYIKNILIPDQKGNSDSCTTLNYEAILKYVMLHDMIVLGWIHTHPEYECFLSSIDLHTQYSYQKLLPEAIAIVYSGLPIAAAEK